MNSPDKWETTVTAEDQAYYQQLYQYEGANKSQNDLTPFLRRAQKVSTQQLNQILGAAFQANTINVDDNKKSFYIALKLIACAQNDIDPSSPILSTSTPLPVFEDYEIITSKDRQKYLRIFQASGPTDGVITGDKAMKILMRSKLPVSILSQIWNLADTDRQGKLDSTGFVIAMHYVAKCMNGNKTSLPHANAPDSILISARGQSPSLATMIATKHTSSPPATAKSSSTSPPPPPPVSATQPPVQVTNERTDIFSPLPPQQSWTIDNAELANYTDAFNKIDTQHKGYIEGSEAVGFFGHSKLPSSDLAGIWDLADTRNRGQLSQDEFAIAMHLIRRVRGGTSLPSTLPATLLSHVDSEKRKSLENQASQLKQSIENEQQEITVLQGSVQKQDSVVSDLQQQVDTLEQSLQQLVKQKSDLQTTFDNLKRSEDDKRHKIAQLEKEYNITQTELASLKTAHQQRLSLVGISNSQLASAQSLRDKSAEELALAQSGKFDALTESSPKSNDAPPPPPPSSRHHRTQSLRNQQPSGSPNKRPPAPPPSKKKRAPVPSASDSKIATDSEKALAAAVSAGVTSVVASSVLTGLTTSPKSPIALDSTPMNADNEKVPSADNHMEETPTLPNILANDSTDDEKEQTKEGDTTTPESQNDADENSNEAPTSQTTISDEPVIKDGIAAVPISKDDIEKVEDSPLNANAVDDATTTDHTPLTTNLGSNNEATDNAKAVISDINTTENPTNAKDEPPKAADIDIAPKETLTGTTDAVSESDAKGTPDTEVDKDTTVNKAVPSEVGSDEKTTAEPSTETTRNIDNTADTNDTQQQSAIAGENKTTSVNESSDAHDIDDESKGTEIASKSTDTNKSKDAMDDLTTTNDNTVNESEQTTITASNDVEQPGAPAIPDVKKAADMTPSGGRTEIDSGDAIPNGSPVVVEPVDSGSKQPLTEANRAFDDTHTGSPEIHTATTTASGSLKGDDHDFEVVDNASASSSFMSASMGADDDGLDEFDVAFSETLPDAKMIMSSTTSTSGTATAPSSNAPTSGFDDFDEAFDPKVFTPAKEALQSDQQPDLGQQVDSSRPKNDPFAVHDTGFNNNSFADAFTPFTVTPSQQGDATNIPSAFGDSFTAPHPQISTEPATASAQNQPVSTDSIPAPEFTELKNLVVSPEQVADYESNPFDEPSFERPPEIKDQQGMHSLDSDRPVESQSSGQPQQPQEPTIQQPIAPASAHSYTEQFNQTAQTPTQSVEHSFMDSVQPNTQQPPSSPRRDDAQANLHAPLTVSPSVSSASNTQSDRQSQQSQQRPAPAPAPAPAAEGQTASSKGKHKGLFSLSSMLPKQKGKKSKSSKSSKKDKSGSGHDAATTQQPPPQSPTAMQHYQDPSLENTLPGMSDQEVMANLRDFGNDSESMMTLTNMGFTADQAKEALQRYDYDLQKATNFLLDQ